MKEGGNQMMTIKKFVLLGIFTAVLLAFSAPAGYATSGGAGEPGANCPVISTYQYLAPPYIGTITAVWETGDMKISGLVEQVGNSACEGNIPPPGVLFGAGITLPEFQALMPNNIRGACLVGYEVFFECVEGGFFEIVGAGKMKFTSETSFTAEVVIMQLIDLGF
jgi:hypothetical protein